MLAKIVAVVVSSIAAITGGHALASVPASTQVATAGAALPAAVIKTSYADGRIVYRYGSVFDGKTPGPDLGPYQVGNISVPSHGYYQQWTDRTNAPLTVKVTPAQIVAANRSFIYGNMGLSLISIPTITFAGPMDNAKVTKYMPTTGAGSDRSLITDYSAHFMRTGDPTSMFAQALAADSIPINYVDATTGKPIDLIAHPLANSYGAATGVYQPYFMQGPLNAAGTNTQAAGGWTPSTDHFPALTYTAFEATHDVGLLFNLQAAAIFAFTAEPYESGHVGYAVIGAGQTRHLAWGLRMLFEADAATRDAETLGLDMTGLQPSSYFKKLLDNNLKYRSPIMSDPKAQTFRLLGPQTEDIGPWQVDYLLGALGLGVLTGHSEWAPLYLWALGNAIARTNGTSGWPPAWCGAYKMDTIANPTGNLSADINLPRITWAQSFDEQMTQKQVMMTKVQHDAILANPLKLVTGTDGTALMGCYATLAEADYLDKKGLVAVRATYPDFDASLTNITNLMKSWGQYAPQYQISERFSVITDASKVPNTLVPVTPPVTPPVTTPPVITPPVTTPPVTTTPPPTTSTSVQVSNVRIIGIPASTPGDSSLTAVNSCPATLSAGKTCAITVSFSPQSAGLHQATLAFDTTSGESGAVVTNTVLLTGNATTVSVPPTTPVPTTTPVVVPPASTTTTSGDHPKTPPVTTPTTTSTTTPAASSSGATLMGTQAGETLEVSQNIHSVDGKGGYDIAFLTLSNGSGEQPNSSWFKIVHNSDGSYTATSVRGPSYSVRLYNIEEIKFLRGPNVKLGLSSSGVVSFLYSLQRSFELAFQNMGMRIAIALSGGDTSSNLAAVVIAVPPSIDFGQVPVGQTVVRSVTVSFGGAGTTPVIPPTPTNQTSTSTTFTIGKRVLTKASLNVRPAASTAGTLLGTEPAGAVGTIVGGPATLEKRLWWKVQYANGLTGWSVQDYLQVKTGG